MRQSARLQHVRNHQAAHEPHSLQETGDDVQRHPQRETTARLQEVDGKSEDHPRRLGAAYLGWTQPVLHAHSGGEEIR